MRDPGKKPRGWVGTILRADLTRRKTTTELLGRYYQENGVGGRGIGQIVMFEEVEPASDALGPENKVILGAGPLVGTLAPTCGRMSVETKNPLTGGLTSSNMGGHIAAEMKYAGFDAIVVEGVASEPSVLVIRDGVASIESMPELWGKTTFQTEEALHARLGGSGWRVASIGPAGENLVRGACLIGERGRAAGRGGSGAVLGSKKLKAIAVRGSGRVQVAHPAEFLREVRECWAKIDRSGKVAGLRIGGTHWASGAGGDQGLRSQAVRNYRDEFWPAEKTERIRQPVFRDMFEVRRLACFNCPIYCSHFYRVSSGRYAGTACEGIQTNTIRAFGSNLDIDEPSAIVAAQELCSQLGIDVDMAAATVAWAFELYERGILDTSDTAGLELRWGNHEPVPVLLTQIAYREGLGALLADGVKRAAQVLGRGSERYAMHVKGADLNEQGMRWNKAWAFGIVTSSRGGGHLDGAPQTGFWHIPAELGVEKFGVPSAGDPAAYADNAPLVVWYEDYKAAIDALGACYFTSYWEDVELLSQHDYARLFSLATGEEMDGDGLMAVGRRIQETAKAFNTLHAGFTRQDDFPPRRLLEEPALSGAYQGEKLDPVMWNSMLDAYYEAHGWDKSTGLQTRECLVRLGLEGIARKLAEHGALW